MIFPFSPVSLFLCRAVMLKVKCVNSPRDSQIPTETPPPPSFLSWEVLLAAGLPLPIPPGNKKGVRVDGPSYLGSESIRMDLGRLPFLFPPLLSASVAGFWWGSERDSWHDGPSAWKCEILKSLLPPSILSPVSVNPISQAELAILRPRSMFSPRAFSLILYLSIPRYPLLSSPSYDF